MGRFTTWLACGLLALAPVAGGSALDRRLGTSFLFTLIGCVLAALYLLGTFAPAAPLFGRSTRVRDEAGRFALTFDDGPDPRFTPAISRLLTERGHRATFFVLGTHARDHPQLLRQVLADGHEIASHGFDRPSRRSSRPRVGPRFACFGLRTACAAPGSATRSAASATGTAAGRAASSIRPGPASRPSSSALAGISARARSCSCTTATDPGAAPTAFRPSRLCPRSSMKRSGGDCDRSGSVPCSSRRSSVHPAAQPLQVAAERPQQRYPSLTSSGMGRAERPLSPASGSRVRMATESPSRARKNRPRLTPTETSIACIPTPKAIPCP